MQNEGATQKILSALEQAALNHHIDIVDVELVLPRIPWSE